MAGLPNEQIEGMLWQICRDGTQHLPETALHMRPDCLLAVVVAGVGRLEHQHEPVASFSFVFSDKILDRLGLVHRMIVRNNVFLLGLQQIMIRYLAA